MKTTKLLITILAAAVLARAETPPTAHIANELIGASVYLPDAEAGYYRGTRFDWSGVIYHLTYAGHEYFGEWQAADDPYLHDRITGPVESFNAENPLGYDEAPAGGTFVRIGVGVCEKPEEEAFRWLHTYRIVDHGDWRVTHGANWIEFVQQIDDPHSGYGYRYAKRLTLTPGRAELVIDHLLENIGRQPIETNAYNHNFFVIDGQPTGPDFVVRFPFAPTADRDLGWTAAIRGRELVFGEPIPDGKAAFGYLEGFGDTADDHRFEIENRTVRAGVRMATDRPMSSLRYWSPRTTLCPEPFIEINVPLGHIDRWSTRYEFYTLD